MRQRTKAPAAGSRPMEFPPSGADFEVIAGGIGWMVREIERPGTADSWGAVALNIAYTESRNDRSFLTVVVT